MSKYFSQKEIACNCGCGQNNVSDKLMRMADEVREDHGKPINASSICRCYTHNELEGGSSTSSHISTDKKKCLAIDFETKGSAERYSILKSMIKAGFTRIGIAKTFIHGDIDDNKVQEITWLY